MMMLIILSLTMDQSSFVSTLVLFFIFISLVMVLDKEPNESKDDNTSGIVPELLWDFRPGSISNVLGD